MALEIRNISGHRGINYKPLRNVCEKILSDMKIPDVEVSLLFVDDEYIKKMNKKYLNRNRPTDVIAFSMLEDKKGGMNKTERCHCEQYPLLRGVSPKVTGCVYEAISFSSLLNKSTIRVLGDIVISVDAAKRQAKDYKHSLNKELKILFIHGLFHLFGYDDISRKSRREMLKMEMKYR